MKLLFTVILTGIAWLGNAQNFSLEGNILDDEKSPLVSSSVVLLNPVDSTMQSFGITNKEGHFEIKNIKKGDYLLQVAFLGFETYYKYLTIPENNNSIGTVTMKAKPVDVEEIRVVGEYIPLAIKSDTIEYNANAFRLKPDAVTEDLLKKLPGIEVDRAGNIKAMGEDVNKLYVDGKEFFGNDPKVATKNVPADAVEKVQVFNRKSETAMFTGINDGSREKAINLQLKEDKKNAVFGDLMAGGGVDEFWQGSAKAYRFTDKIQLAALGTANNVNQFGFSLNDYLNFNGGISNMMHGSGSAQIRITNDGSFPVNFGQPVSGLNTSMATGVNFSYSTNPNSRYFISYLGSGTKKNLLETTKTWNYTSESEYFQNQELNELNKNQSQGLNFGIRTQIDSKQNIVIDGNLTLSNGNNNRQSLQNTFSANRLVNQLTNNSINKSDRISGNASGSYIKKINQGKSVFNLSGNFNFSGGLSQNLINTNLIYNEIQIDSNSKFQDNKTENMNYSASGSFTRKIGKTWYFTPKISKGEANEILNRTQGTGIKRENKDEDFSPDFQKNYQWLRPELNFKRTTSKSTFSLSAQIESGKLKNKLNSNQLNEKSRWYFLPSAMYEFEYQTGRRILLNYSSAVNTPNVSQLLPIADNLNPLAVYYGNPELKPEKSQNFYANWILFDQFSFTSFMASLNGNITKDKINWDRTINENFSMTNRLTNVEYDYNISGNFDFSTPIRSLGIKINLNLEEKWNKGLNLVNSVENEYTSFGHRISLSFDNRKKEKWDVKTGVEMSLTNSKYSVQKSLNNQYFNMSLFGDIRYTPNNNWNFVVNSDIASYSNQSFDETIKIPLIGAEASYFFLKNNRGTLSVKGFDLLNKNTILQRFSELNYLREIRSNSIGRFVMLSFTYRLNKFGSQTNGIEIRTRR